MRIRVFLLASALLALVGLCAVQESSRAVRAEYALARLLAREQQALRDFEALRAREAVLLRVERLEALNLSLSLDARPLRGHPDAGGPAIPGAPVFAER